jgi:hypothetical protein
MWLLLSAADLTTVFSLYKKKFHAELVDIKLHIQGLFIAIKQKARYFVWSLVF